MKHRQERRAKRRVMKSRQSTRQLVGVKTFSQHGLLTYSKGELVFFKVNPVNISVLSRGSIETKVRRLMMVLSAVPDIEICCLDSSECFDENKIYLQKRIQEEDNPAVRKLLRQDFEFLDQIQIETATAREFLLIVRFREIGGEKSFADINRIEKTVREQGFETSRVDRDALGRMLAIYFEQNMTSEIDNERWEKANAIFRKEAAD